MTKNAVKQPGLAPVEQQALEHVWIHSARWLDLAERDGLRVMVRGEGCQLFDAQGRSYLDGLAGLYVVNVGHGRREIGEALAKQAGGAGHGFSARLPKPVGIKDSERLAQVD